MHGFRRFTMTFGCPGRAALVIAVLLAAGYRPAAAQTRTITLAIENDAFASIIPGQPRSDREYTHGTRLAVERSDAPLWSAVFGRVPPCTSVDTPERGCLRTRFEAGQKIFTPDIHADEPPPAERPYAGWLYLASTARIVKPRTMRSVEVELGVTGGPSMAEHVHRFIHRISRLQVPDGWEHQLAFEPGLAIRYGERRVLERRRASGMRSADLVLASELAVGTVSTAVQGSVTARAGRRVPHPWHAGDAGAGLRVYGLAGARQRWTARDLFLDGNTFRDGPSVQRRPFTGSFEIGAAAEYRRFRLTFSKVYQSRLYVTQPRRHIYGSVRLTYEP